MGRQMRVSLAISHTPWKEERLASMGRLMQSLGVPNGFEAFEVFGDPAANHEWSEAMWSWAADQDVDWCVFLQDDTLVCPDFRKAFEGLLSPERDVIGLQVAHPSAPRLYDDGYKWFTTSDALVGVAYAIRQADLAAFL